MFYGNKGESQGNQVFADLLPHLIRVIENVGMLIIDEFGNSLHNKLAEKIIEFFMENVALLQIMLKRNASSATAERLFHF